MTLARSRGMPGIRVGPDWVTALTRIWAAGIVGRSQSVPDSLRRTGRLSRRRARAPRKCFAVKSLRCLAGRHEWRSGVDKDRQPYEVCVHCKHYRYPDRGGSRFSYVDFPPSGENPGPGSGFSGV